MAGVEVIASQSISGTLTVANTTTLSTVANASGDTDKFLVSDSGAVKYRTGAQVLSDIGAASSGSLASYLPLAGGTMTGDVIYNDDVKIKLGTGGGNSDIYHNGTDMMIRQHTAAGDMSFAADSTGSGGSSTTYFALDGGTVLTRFYKGCNFNDDVKLTFGDITTPGDLEIYHDEDHSYITDTGTGSLIIRATDLQINNSANTANMITGTDGGAVTLYCDGAVKAATSSSGFSVTGKQTISTIDAVGSDTDKFLMSDSGEVKYVTGSNLRSYIGAGTVDGSGAANRVAYWSDSDTLTSDGDLTFDGTNLTCSNDVHCLGVGNDGQGSNIAFDVNGFTWTVGSYGMSMNTSGRLLVNEDISCTGLTSDAGISVSGGDVVLDGDANVQLDHSLGSGETSGTIVKYGSGMLTAGDVYYGYSSMGSFTWGTVNHTSANSTYLLAVAIGTSATSNGMLLNGILYKSSHGFTVGAPLYLASSNGDFTTTVPTTSNYYARVLGYAIDASHIYFCPDNTWVKID